MSKFHQRLLKLRIRTWTSGDSKVPDDPWVDGHVLGKKNGEPIIENPGRIRLYSTDGHEGFVDVWPGIPFEAVVRFLRDVLWSEVKRQEAAGREQLFPRPIDSSLDRHAAKEGKLTLRTSDGTEMVISIARREFIEDVIKRVMVALNDMASGWTSNIASKPWPHAPVNAGQLYMRSHNGVYLPAGTRLTPDAPLPKGEAEVITSGTYQSNDPIPCIWRGHGQAFPATTRWVFVAPPPGCSLYAYGAPVKDRPLVPVDSLGIVYPKIANTSTHDTAVFATGMKLIPSSYPDGLKATPPSIALLTGGVHSNGVGLLCKTVDGSPWPEHVSIWTFNAPPAGCFSQASAIPPKP